MSSLRVAIVGAGPAGFYAAERLLRAPGARARVELFDRLPTPWGLVRAGVAPDHPTIKAVSRVYQETARLPGFRFHGNVEVGSDLSHGELAEHHHAVIYAYGACADRRLGISGEDLPGSYAATDVVAWYNGHPDAADLQLDLSGRRAVVIGNGNVALDIARMLALITDELAATDIADHALEALATSRIEEVVVLGRRGPAQASYTTPELRQLGELIHADVVVSRADAELDPASRAWLEKGGARGTARRNVELVQAYARRGVSGKRRRVLLRYLASPVEILGDGRVQRIVIARNELIAAADGTLRARATDRHETVECDLVVRSVGYRGRAVPGVPFDESTHTIPSLAGRALDPATRRPLPGTYVAGWIKRGPSGVIGTNKKCANETVASLLEDYARGRLPAPLRDPGELDMLLGERVPGRVDYAGWERIDQHECSRGQAEGRPRVKLTQFGDLLAEAGPASGW